MPNVVYPRFKQALLSPGVNLATATVSTILVDTATYTYSPTHEFLSSIPAGARAGTPQPLTSKTVTNGVFDAAAVQFPTVPLGSALEAVVVYVNTGNDATSRLVAFIDTAEGLPVTPNGGNIDVDWDEDGVFEL